MFGALRSGKGAPEGGHDGNMKLGMGQMEGSSSPSRPPPECTHQGAWTKIDWQESLQTMMPDMVLF